MTTRVEIRIADGDGVLVETRDEADGRAIVEEVKYGETLIAYVDSSRVIRVSEKRERSDG